MNFTRVTAIVGAVLVVAAAARAEVSVPKIFGDHMVLQRDAKIAVWGWADTGEEVSVSIAGQSEAAVAGEDGRWDVTLKPLPGPGPHTLSIKGEDNALSFEDVLIGEVWICSGQSNMEWPVERSRNAEEEIANANYPNIRLFQVKHHAIAEPQKDVTGEWAVCSPESIPSFSAVGYFFGRRLHKELDVPIGLLKTAWGGTPSEAWTSRPSLERIDSAEPLLERWDRMVEEYPERRAEYEKALEEWELAKTRAEESGGDVPAKPRPPQSPTHPHRPANLYNGMIAPLVPFTFRGAIWYQGESNASRAYQYRDLFPAMIEDWRRAWGGWDFPFYFVQLANFRERAKQAAEPSDWAELREAQTMTLSLPNTGMAVIIDIGEADDIHPRNKQDVGKRLALWALAKNYGNNITYSGPLFDSMDVEGDAVRLHFKHTDGGLMAKGEQLKGFAVAGSNQEFVDAKASIEGDTVVVRADAVKEPVAVRYGWADNPNCNLYNEAGLPASPFRTDDWPGVTAGNF